MELKVYKVCKVESSIGIRRMEQRISNLILFKINIAGVKEYLLKHIC